MLNLNEYNLISLLVIIVILKHKMNKIVKGYTGLSFSSKTYFLSDQKLSSVVLRFMLILKKHLNFF